MRAITVLHFYSSINNEEKSAWEKPLVTCELILNKIYLLLCKETDGNFKGESKF